MTALRSCALLAGLTVAGTAGATPFDLNIIPLFTADDDDLGVLSSAETFWESRVTGYAPGISIGVLDIELGIYDIDGEGGILAEGGFYDFTEQGGYILPTYGFVDFDYADLFDLDEAEIFATLIHEIAHVMGFGTLWEANGLYEAGSGMYTGAYGLAAYRAEFDPLATFIPVELTGGDGTADGHWAEDWAGGYDEIMTGYADPDEYLSYTTVASFADIGYTVAPVPLPAAFPLALLGLGGLAVAARRRA